MAGGGLSKHNLHISLYTQQRRFLFFFFTRSLWPQHKFDEYEQNEIEKASIYAHIYLYTYIHTYMRAPNTIFAQMK